MTKQPLKLSHDPAAITMMSRLLDSYDRSVLTRNQIAQVIPVREALRAARDKLNLMARAEIILETPAAVVYTHPDKRDEKGLMIYDRAKEDLYTQIPFCGSADASTVDAWLSDQPRN